MGHYYMPSKDRRESYLIGEVDRIPVSVRLDQREVSSNVQGQVELKITLRENGEPKIDVSLFNITSNSVRSNKSETGILSVALVPNTSNIDYNHKDGSLTGNFTVSLHYPLIDKEKGWEFSKPDNFISYREIYVVDIKGKFYRPLKPHSDKYESIKVSMDFKPASDDGFLTSIKIPHIKWHPSIIYFRWEFRTFYRGIKTLDIQPVFIRDNDEDLNPTGSSFHTLLQNANIIWNKCCVSFYSHPPLYINDSSLRVLKKEDLEDGRWLYEEGPFSKIDEETPKHENRIEVFVVERFDPASFYGGGATWSGGSASAKIITTDNQLPTNQNHLAHELGHVLNLGHPGSDDSLTPGCVDSVMEPSGFFADNPSEQCMKNCNSANNPIIRSLQVTFPLCRMTPENT